jgi:hypothetical protein
MKKALQLISCGSLAACLALSVRAAGNDKSTSRADEVIRSYELPPFSLTEFGYSLQELQEAAPFGLTSFDRPAIGSGLAHVQGNWFFGITDRGPNLDHFLVDQNCVPSGSSNGKTYPLPQFTPAIVLFQAIGGELAPQVVVNLITPEGQPITGLSNLPGDDNPFDDPCSNSPIPFNPNGMDVEDIALLPGNRFISVEENRPSIFIGDLTTGVVEKRFIPENQGLPGAGYEISATLPEVLKNRRNNRGFESIAVSGDYLTAYTATQSPLGSTSSGSPYRNSRVLRILRLDVSDPGNLMVTGQFVFIMSDRTVYPSSINQRDLKLSAMSWVGPDKLLLLERSDESGRGGVRLILADLAAATNVHGLPLADTLSLEDVNEGPDFNNVTPVSTTVVFEEFETDLNRQFWTYKIEGMAILNANQVALTNDNDFGVVGDPDAPTNLWILQLKNQLPLGK